MAKSRGRFKIRRGHRKPTISLAIVSGLAVPAVTAWGVHKQYGMGPVVDNGISNFVGSMTGYDINYKAFSLSRLKDGLLPVFLGAGVHKAASWFGINRMLAQAGIPFIRI
jgi:hypothetical protein